MAEEPELINYLRPKTVDISQLYLDPNNPRLLGISRVRSRTIGIDRIPENGVQNYILELMINERNLNVKMLYDSIKEIGFLPIDQIIVREIGHAEAESNKKYYVIEGNRRLSAIKWLLRDHERGEITLSESIIRSLTEIRVLEYFGPGERAYLDRLVLQGTRHISGIQDWGPWERSCVMVELYESGKTATDIKKILHARSATEVMRFIRAHYCLLQMENDDEFGQYAEPNMFTNFLEIMARPWLRDEWLGWEEEEKRFAEEDNLHLFYSWITPSELLGGARKIPQSIEIRKLEEILTDDDARLALLIAENTIHDAYAVFINKLREREREINYEDEFDHCIKLLEMLPADLLLELRIIERINKMDEQIQLKKRLIGRLRNASS